MTKKKSMVEDVIHGVKKAAAKLGDLTGEAVGEAPNKLYERVVPVPQIDTYSELPFALVAKAGDHSAKNKKTTAASGAPRKRTAAAKAKKSVKKSARRRPAK